MNFFVMLARLKNYFNQAGVYFSLINLVLTIGIFKQSYDIPISTYLLIPLCFGIFLIAGWIDFNYIKPHEYTHANTINDINKKELHEILAIAKEIKAKT